MQTLLKKDGHQKYITYIYIYAYTEAIKMLVSSTNINDESWK